MERQRGGEAQEEERQRSREVERQRGGGGADTIFVLDSTVEKENDELLAYS